MASWTDNPQIAFTPYVQQVPTEAHVSVGVELQRRYDEGVQKIQSSIDRVAGLDIARDVDKKYLQSKLNELGTRLRTVAAGDFSNYQLTNHVAGMASSVGKDENVIGAVASTARYRREVEAMNKARKDGKSAIQNEWDFTNRANSWLNGTEVGESFSDTYTPYTDVDKKWFEVLKTLHSDLREEDITSYTVKKADGSVDYEQTAAAMQRVSKENVSAEKIENALRASLSPDELNQLSINGRYQFRGATVDDLVSYATTKYNSLIAQNNEAIKYNEGLANLSTSDPETKYTAEAAITSLKRKNELLKTELDEEIEAIKKDPERAKADIYRNGAIEQFAIAHSWEHNKFNVMANPIIAVEHWEKEYALNKDKFAFEQDKFSWTQTKDQFDMNMADKEFQLKLQKQLMDTQGVAAPFETYLGESTKVKSPLAAMMNDENDARNAADAMVTRMVKEIPGVNVDQVNNAIERYNGGKDDWYKENNKVVIPVEWRDEVDNIINNRAKAKRLETLRVNVTNEVKSSDEFRNQIAEIDRSIQELPPITTVYNGRSITFSQDEVAEFMRKRMTGSKFKDDMPRFDGDITAGVFYSEPLTSKERVLAQNMQTDFQTYNSVYRYYDKTGNKMKEVYKEANKKIQAKLMERSGSYIPRVTAIVFGSGEGNIARRTWEGYTSNILTKYNGDINRMKGGAETLTKGDISELMSWMTGSDKDDLQYKKLTQGDKTFLIVINGDKEHLIPLDNQDASQLPLSDPREASSLYKEVVETQWAFNGTTNPSGKYEDSFFNRMYFPKTTYEIKADLTWNKSNTSKQYITLRLKTPIGVLPLQLDNNPLTRDDAIRFITNLTNEDIKRIYLDSSVVSDRWKEVIQTLK